MATALTSLASVTLSATLTAASGTIGSAEDTLSKGYGSAFTNGTGAGKADLVYWSQGTLTASAHTDLDLTALTDPLGNAITFVYIKALVVAAASGNTNNVVVGNASGSPLAGLFAATSGAAVVRPGAVVAWACGSADTQGYPVTAVTANLLRLTNSAAGTSVTYDVTILGTSA